MLNKNLKISGIDVKKLNIKDPCIKKILPVEIVPGEKVLNPYSYINYPDNIGHACYDREVNAANIREIKDMYEAKIQIDGNDIGAFHTKFYFDWASGFVENNLVHHCRSDVSETSWTKALGTNNNLNTFYKLIKVDSESYQLQRCYETGQLWDNKYYDIDTKYVNFSDCAGIKDSNTSYFKKYYQENSRHSGPDFIIKKAEPKIIDNSYGGAPIIAYTRPAEIYEYVNNNATKAGELVGQFSTDYGAFYFSYKNAQDLSAKSYPTKIAFQYKGQDLFKGKMDVEIIKKARDKCNLGEFKEDDEEEYTFFLAEYDRNCASKKCISGNSSTKPVPHTYSTTFTSPSIMGSRTLTSYGLFDCENEIKPIQDIVDAQKIEITGLKERITELEGTIRQLEEAGGADTAPLEKLREELQREKEAVFAKDTEIENLTAQVEKLQSSASTTMFGDIKAKTALIKDLKAQINRLKAEHKEELRQEKEAALATKKAEIEKLEGEIEDLNAQLKESGRKVNELEEDLQNKARDLEQKNTAISQSSDKIRELTTQLDEKKTLISQLEVKIRDVERLEQDNEDLKVQADKLMNIEEKLRLIAEKLNREKAALKVAVEEKAEAHEQVNDLMEKLAKVQGVARDCDDQLQEKIRDLTAKETEIKTLKKQNTALDEQITELQTNSKKLQKKTEEDIAAKENEIRDLKKQITELEESKGELQREIDDAEEKQEALLEDAMKEAEPLKKELQDALDKISDLEQKIAELNAKGNSSDCGNLTKDVQQQLEKKENELIELQKSCAEDKEKLQEKIDSIKAGIDRCAELEDCKEQVTEKEKQLNEMIGLHEKEKQKLQKEVDDLRAIATDKGIVDQLTQQLKDKETEIDNLRKDIKECESKTSDSRLSECNREKEGLLADLTNKIGKLKEKEKEIAKLKEKISGGKKDPNDNTGDNGTDINDNKDDNGTDDPKYVFGYTNKYGCTKFISPSQIDLPIEDLLKKYSDKVITPKSGNIDNCYALEAIKCAYDDSFYQDPMYLY